MKVKVITDYLGEGKFPTFPKGTRVTLTGEGDTHFLHWFPCEIEGHQTYVPESFIADDVLTRDYNPTELVQKEGDILGVAEIINAWLFATNENGVTGWIPAEAIISIP